MLRAPSHCDLTVKFRFAPRIGHGYARSARLSPGNRPAPLVAPSGSSGWAPPRTHACSHGPPVAVRFPLKAHPRFSREVTKFRDLNFVTSRGSYASLHGSVTDNPFASANGFPRPRLAIAQCSVRYGSAFRFPVTECEGTLFEVMDKKRPPSATCFLLP